MINPNRVGFQAVVAWVMAALALSPARSAYSDRFARLDTLKPVFDASNICFLRLYVGLPFLTAFRYRRGADFQLQLNT
jgi:hypothetical protein